MSNRTLQLLIIFTVAAVVFLLTANILPFLRPSQSGIHLKPSNIKSVSVNFEGVEYPLNQRQQIQFVEAINAAIPIGQEEYTSKQPLNMGYFEIYFFDKNEKLVLKPVGLINKNLIFKVPEWNKEGWIKDVTEGKLLQILKDSHTNDQATQNP